MEVGGRLGAMPMRNVGVMHVLLLAMLSASAAATQQVHGRWASNLGPGVVRAHGRRGRHYMPLVVTWSMLCYCSDTTHCCRGITGTGMGTRDAGGAGRVRIRGGR